MIRKHKIFLTTAAALAGLIGSLAVSAAQDNSPTQPPTGHGTMRNHPGTMQMMDHCNQMMNGAMGDSGRLAKPDKNG